MDWARQVAKGKVKRTSSGVALSDVQSTDTTAAKKRKNIKNRFWSASNNLKREPDNIHNVKWIDKNAIFDESPRGSVEIEGHGDAEKKTLGVDKLAPDSTVLPEELVTNHGVVAKTIAKDFSVVDIPETEEKNSRNWGDSGEGYMEVISEKKVPSAGAQAPKAPIGIPDSVGGQDPSAGNVHDTQALNSNAQARKNGGAQGQAPPDDTNETAHKRENDVRPAPKTLGTSIKKFIKSDNTKKLLLDFTAVFIYNFFTLGGSIVSRKTSLNAEPWQRSVIAAGFVFIGSLIQNCTVESLGGVYVNPLYTVVRALFYPKKDKWNKVPGFLIVQLLGAFLAAFGALHMYSPDKHDVGLTLPILGVLDAIVFEFFGTAVATFVRLVLVEDTKLSPRIRGLYMSVLNAGLSFLGGFVSGASFNPFRSISSSVVSHNYQDAYVYWVGPPIGALVGGVCHRLVKGLNTDSEQVAPDEDGAAPA